MSHWVVYILVKLLLYPIFLNVAAIVNEILYIYMRTVYHGKVGADYSL